MVQLVRQDLQFILDQILLAESGGDPPTAFHPWGLRTVNGFRNHLIPGQETWGSADQNFLRMLTPVWRDGTPVLSPGLPGQPVGSATSYLQTNGFVFDTSIRMISNLIVDQTENNPAAVEANGGAPVVVSPGLDGIFGTADDKEVFFIANIAPDEGLSAPFNSWFTLFGQFFDHGLDLVNKGGSGTVFMPLMPDDPLYDMGGDGVVSADDGAGQGSRASDSGEGEDDFVFHLSKEEFMQVFFDDLALPNLARTTLAEKSGSSNCSGETLTAMRMWSGQPVASSQARCSTHWPIDTIRRVSSAMGTNLAGLTMPCSGLFQRTSASALTIFCVASSTMGW